MSCSCSPSYMYLTCVHNVFVIPEYTDYLALYLDAAPLTWNLRTRRLLSFNAIGTHWRDYNIIHRLRPLATSIINFPHCAWITHRMNQSYKCHITLYDTSCSVRFQILIPRLNGQRRHSITLDCSDSLLQEYTRPSLAKELEVIPERGGKISSWIRGAHRKKNNGTRLNLIY